MHLREYHLVCLSYYNMEITYTRVKAPILLAKFECPPDAKAVILETIQDQKYDLTSIPRCVIYIKFGKYFNQQIEGDALPDGLLSLTFHDGLLDNDCFRNHYNQPIEKNVLPITLQYIHFGGAYNRPIGTNVLPDGLQSLEFGWCFQEKINKDVLPKGLQSLIFGCQYNQPIEKDVLPEGLQVLKFGFNYNKLIEKDVLPKGLKVLKFGQVYNQPIEKDVLPNGLETIYLGYGYKQSFDNISPNTKLCLYNVPHSMQRNYTIYQHDRKELEELIANSNKKISEIYTSKIGKTYYMADVEIIKPAINKDKVLGLIVDLKKELEKL